MEDYNTALRGPVIDEFDEDDMELYSANGIIDLSGDMPYDFITAMIMAMHMPIAMITIDKGWNTNIDLAYIAITNDATIYAVLDITLRNNADLTLYAINCFNEQCDDGQLEIPTALSFHPRVILKIYTCPHLLLYMGIKSVWDACYIKTHFTLGF